MPLGMGPLVSGPFAGRLSDKYGHRLFALGGPLLMAASFGGMLALPTGFSYPVFAVLIFLNGVGSGIFSAPNASMVMSRVSHSQRGAAAGMRATFAYTGSLLSIGLFFSVMVAGLAGSLPHGIVTQLTAQSVPPAAAQQVASVPPMEMLFAALLGRNPMQQLLGAHVLAGPLHHGLIIVFWLAYVLCLAAAATALLRPAPPTLQRPVNRT